MKKIAFQTILCLALAGFSSSGIIHTKDQEVTEKKIKLYIYPGCPYCKKVETFLKSNGVLSQVVIINANNKKQYEELKALSGRDICPYLHDEVHNVKMSESTKIINYFKQLFNI